MAKNNGLDLSKLYKNYNYSQGLPTVCFSHHPGGCNPDTGRGGGAIYASTEPQHNFKLIQEKAHADVQLHTITSEAITEDADFNLCSAGKDRKIIYSARTGVQWDSHHARESSSIIVLSSVGTEANRCVTTNRQDNR